MIRSFSRLFVDHPREVGETYLHHAAAASRFGLKLARLSGCAFAHAIVPGVHKTTVSEEIKRRIGLPFWIDTLGGSRHVEIRLRLQNSVMRILVPRSQTYASNSHIFLVWMGATSRYKCVSNCIYLY